MIDTKQKILDTAERLFGEAGYGATSLRQIIAEAEVNVAAVHYHFGGKEDLLDAVIAQRAVPVTQRRDELLNQAEAEAAPDFPPVQRILEAFFLPMAEVAEQDPTFPKLIGRMLSEGLMPQVVQRHFRDSSVRFLGALARALPHLNQQELGWRVHFMIGAMAHTMTGQTVLPMINIGGDYETRLRRLARFLSAGFLAPAEDQSGEE